jgi:tetratricopeptide (TPR) repeat protein
MKLRIIIISFLIICLGINLNASPDSLLTKANSYYIDGNFDKAAELYQTLVDSGYQNAELYYNLGNAYFKINRIPYTILNYERAHRLKPNDEDILFNLEFARTFAVDRIEALPVFFLTKWYRTARAILTSNGWAWTSLIFLTLTLTCTLFFWFSTKGWVKRLNFACGVFTLLLTIMSMVFSAQEKHKENLRNQAIIFQQAVSVRSSPGDTGKDIFILHSGTKVEITKALGQWVEIRIADGNKGWVPSETLELI